MRIGKNTVVSVDYTVSGMDGAVIDSSAGQGPLIYLHGAGNIIPGLEKALEGRGKDDNFKVVVAPEDAYGRRDDSLIQQVSRRMFEGMDVQPGMRFHADSDQGVREVVITAVEGDNVTVDGNHPLAGQTLNFELTVLDVRASTAEELAHGHAHNGDGHNH